MWESVAERRHRVEMVFPGVFSAEQTSSEASEAVLMIVGEVKYRMRDGRKKDWTSWAAYAELARGGLIWPWKFRHYEVFLQQ